MAARTPNQAIAAAEDSTAILLAGQDSLQELWLFFRRLERRGLVDKSDAQAAETDFARARRAVEEGLRLAHEKRELAQRSAE